jgi:YebC/PmpR family DNA-binding regulatory protein
MASHSKWHKIKRSKAVTDSKRGKIFTRHAKLIEVAARGGGDADMNPSLRAAIDNARADNMPVENIERAIKKGTGEAKAGMQIEEVIYEGFGPGGVAILIESLTDNRNRTITNLKIIMGRKGGTMGAAGSVGYLFEKKGMIIVPLVTDSSVEQIELAAIDAGADDVSADEDFVEVYTKPTELMQVKAGLNSAGIKTQNANLTYIPLTEVAVNDESTMEQIETLIEALEEDDDVLTVHTNYLPA